MVLPRFTIDRKTGKATCHKPLTAEEIRDIQATILVKQTELHPEIFQERG